MCRVRRSNTTHGKADAMYDSCTRQLGQAIEPDYIDDVASRGRLPPERLRLDLQNVDEARLTTDQRLEPGSVYEANAERCRGKRGSHPHDTRSLLTVRIHEVPATPG